MGKEKTQQLLMEDEFFEIRVAGLMKQLDFKTITTAPDGIPNEVILEQISHNAHLAIQEQYDTLNHKEKMLLVVRLNWPLYPHLVPYRVLYAYRTSLQTAQNITFYCQRLSNSISVIYSPA
ncbi:unnamed protein product [Oppiella nova]|uniref:Polyphosphate kinase N-terminal domain-containing protein n=1 Tax=Oppiella nova TaxID=334625 RepID=A0A7R9LA39_9ACAR|nr:unnamed protein product [Oppiella nova]CAG2157588.1 unnamed protein product [Oppiella nova]